MARQLEDSRNSFISKSRGRGPGQAFEGELIRTRADYGCHYSRLRNSFWWGLKFLLVGSKNGRVWEQERLQLNISL